MLQSIDTCQNKESADQYHVTISRAQVQGSSRSRVFLKLTAAQVLLFSIRSRAHVRINLQQRRVGRKPVNANPGLKFNRIITFSFVQSFFHCFCFAYFAFIKIQNTKTIYRKSHRKVTKLKSKFYFILG